MNGPDGGASPEGKRRLTRLTYYGGALAVAMVALSFLPLDTGPWTWVKLAVLAVGTIILLIWATRFSLWQRDDYWRQRGKDPKHPERLPDHPLE